MTGDRQPPSTRTRAGPRALWRFLRSPAGIAAVALALLLPSSAALLAATPAAPALALAVTDDHAAHGGDETEAAASEGIGWGDHVAFLFTLLDDDGVPFFTNDYAVAFLESERRSDFELKPEGYYSTRPLVLGEHHILGETVQAELLGKHEGSTFLTRRFSAEEIGHTWRPGPTLQRTWGPYPLVETADRDAFYTRIDRTLDVGDAFQLNYKFNATLISQDARSVTFRLAVHDGLVTPVPGLGGQLVTEVDEAAGTFTQRLDVPEGHVFQRSNQRLFDLDTGTYRVDRVDDEGIVLSYAATRNVEVIGRDARILIQVIAVEKANGGDA